MTSTQKTFRVNGRLVLEPEPVESKQVTAPGTGLLLSMEETYLVNGTRYKLVIPGFVPSFFGDEFRRTNLFEVDARGRIGAGLWLSFSDCHQALRWLAAEEIEPL
jgi:hypothetical protein